ncbi:hypothetical protein RA180_11440 [Aeromonas salmonicida]|uniref:hypothetical protein n=1 Tax=Aeromonas salmonicida TaxID=645 RepID=UPI0027966290|nr:hypothetical protein [Aeromonas salmonicida]MDQ1884602.1 hypothetical protein [Aeromonas salmonicida]
MAAALEKKLSLYHATQITQLQFDGRISIDTQLQDIYQLIPASALRLYHFGLHGSMITVQLLFGARGDHLASTGKWLRSDI